MITPEEWTDIEQQLGIARMMNDSWADTYVSIHALTLLRIMKQAGWMPPTPKPTTVVPKKSMRKAK